MGFSPSTGHQVTTSIFSNIVDAATGSFTQGLTVSGTPVTGRDLFIYIRDEKPDGTQGGTFSSGAARTRVLTTIVTDETGDVTLSTNQFTLPAGTYRIWAQAPCYRVTNGYAWLQNITDASLEVQGSNHYDSNASGNTHSHSFISGQFTITATKTFEIQHICFATFSSSGFGNRSSATGDPEIYTQVQLTKLS